MFFQWTTYFWITKIHSLHQSTPWQPFSELHESLHLNVSCMDLKRSDCIGPRSTGTIKQTPGLRWSRRCVKVVRASCLHYTADLEIVLPCAVRPGSLFVFDVFIHHTRSNDFSDSQGDADMILHNSFQVRNSTLQLLDLFTVLSIIQSDVNMKLHQETRNSCYAKPYRLAAQQFPYNSLLCQGM